MTKLTLMSGAARIAIGGMLLGVSTISAAQETVPTVAPVVTAPPVPVAASPAPEPVAAPAPTPVTDAPAADNIAPAALGDIALERAEQRQAARGRAAPARLQRQASAPAAIATSVQSTEAIAPDEPVSATNANIDGAIGAPTDVEPVVSAPIDNQSVEQSSPADDNINDWLVVAGVVGAAGLAGGAALTANRRRRRVVQPVEVQTTTLPLTSSTPDTKAWAAMPVAEPALVRDPVRPAADPVFAKPAITAPSFDPLFAAQPAAAISGDPLFAPRSEPEIPVTDPLFSRKADMPPVTDPMFAHLDEFEGAGAKPKSWAFDSRRDWADTGRVNVATERELEPAE